MLVKLELEEKENLEKVDSFSRGNITIKGKYGTIPSQENQNSQSAMIFLSIVELLDGIYLFTNNENQKQYNYVATDCSFQFYLTKTKLDMLVIEDSKRKKIDEIKQSEFVDCIWESIKKFMNKYYKFLDQNDIIQDDLINSLKSFAKKFDLEPYF